MVPSRSNIRNAGASGENAIPTIDNLFVIETIVLHWIQSLSSFFFWSIMKSMMNYVIVNSPAFYPPTIYPLWLSIDKHWLFCELKAVRKKLHQKCMEETDFVIISNANRQRLMILSLYLEHVHWSRLGC